MNQQIITMWYLWEKIKTAYRFMPISGAAVRKAHTKVMSPAVIHWNGGNDRLFVFEAPIDMLSFISMHKEGWQKNNYAACCGVSDQVLWQMMKDNPNISKVCLCLDNDEAGQSAAKRISDKLFIKGIQHEILVPIHKDWNEDLLYPVEESEAEEPCQMLQL